MTVEHLAHLTKCNINSVKTTISRLKRKGYISLLEQKEGRSGWTKYQINHEIYTNILHQEIFLFPPINGTQTEHKRNTEPNTERNTTGFSSSSFISNNKTTTELPEEWKNINFESLIDIGFSETQLFQLYEKNLNTPETIQESINHFAYALEYSPKCQEYKKDGKNPLNILMGVLRKGGAWFEAEYISPKEKALKELVEFKKKEAERIKKLEEELLQYEFEKWFLSKSEDELNLLIADKKEPGTTENIWKLARKGNLLNYFRQHVFHKIKSDKQES